MSRYGWAESRSRTREYFLIRVWAMPAVLGTYAIIGWYYGLRNVRTPLVLQIFVNGLNIGWTATDGEHVVQTGEGEPDDWLAAADAVILPYTRISASAIAARAIGARRPIVAADHSRRDQGQHHVQLLLLARPRWHDRHHRGRHQA